MDIILRRSLPKLREKLLEALQAVLPIVAIVLVLCFSVAPVSPSILLCFLLGAAMIVVGIMFFTLGAEMSMTPMGERVGAVITRSRKLPLILVLGFLLGFLITISEPDLQVLADQVPSIPSGTLILSVAAGVGLFLVFAFLRMLIGISLISSRKSVPPSACSKRPAWRSRAPVNAPRSKPKSSLSMRDPGSTAQLTLTKGALRLADICWIVVATTSLPQPDSPTIPIVSPS